MVDMYADMIIKNGKVLSCGLNLIRHTGTAVAISGGKIIAVENDEEISKFVSDKTKVVDAKGNTILPGLCDCHCHASFTASSIIACDLFNVFPKEKDTRETVINIFKERLTKYIAEHQEEPIIRGTGWSLSVFGGNSWDLPTRHELDEVCCNKPIVLESFCQHNVWVNTKAIEMAG
ncbi:MAG: amidohydrolase family protein, partial [Clostridia bacterium]|nr:amidohydrolase family protein [Clostridia bacterium]